MKKVPLPTDDESLLRGYMAEVAERLKDLEAKAELKRAKRHARAERKRLKQEAERLQAERERKERQAAIQRRLTSARLLDKALAKPPFKPRLPAVHYHLIAPNRTKSHLIAVKKFGA